MTGSAGRRALCLSDPDLFTRNLAMTVLHKAFAAVAFLALTGWTWTSSAAAPDQPYARAGALQALADCRKIADDKARLACFVQTAGALDQAESKGQVVVIDQAQASAVRRQAFGFHLPTLGLVLRNAPKVGEGVDHLTVSLAEARRGPDGQWLLTTSDGAVWRQTDNAEISVDPRSGDQFVVTHGLLGSYFCKVNSQPQVRCARVS